MLNQKLKKKILLSARVLDIYTGSPWIIVLTEIDAARYGIKAGDSLVLFWGKRSTTVLVNLSKTLIKPGEVGIFQEIEKRYGIKNHDLVELKLLGHPHSIELIQKRLLNKKLSYKEIYEIIKDISSYRLDDVETAFFILAFFFKNPSLQETYYLTKAMVESGAKLNFGNKKVLDKHSVGGLPGNRVTPIIVAIVASYNLYIPKTSSRAVTSAAGTADTFEVLAPVAFSPQEIKKIVEKNNACLVWGADGIAPVDDRIIKVAYDLTIEPFAKMVVSIMAKKIAMGIKYLIVDIPVNPTAKIKNLKEAEKLKFLFKYLAKKFKMKIDVIITKSDLPVGRGIGPILEARDLLRVLQQKKNRPLDLEEKSIRLSGRLLELANEAKPGQGYQKASKALISGRAWTKMQAVIKAQGGNPIIDSESLRPGRISFAIKSTRRGTVKAIENSHLAEVTRLLGAPFIKKAGIYLNKTVGEKVERGEVLLTFYTVSSMRLNLAKEAIKRLPIYTIN